MLLEMQNAMNNMMTNSQLHHMLHGTQTAVPCSPTEPIPIPNTTRTSTSPSSSSASSSSTSSTSSTSSVASSSSSAPSSPQSVSADSESNVPMDTSMSSASSCASDSGEEDAISGATGAQENMFMFEQEGPAGSPVSPARGSPSLGLAEQLSQSSMEERAEYGSRCSNDSSNMAASPPQSYHPTATIYMQLPQSWPYREERSSSNSSSYCTVQQLNGTPSGTYAANTQSSYRYIHNVNEQVPAVPGNQGHLVSVMSVYH